MSSRQTWFWGIAAALLATFIYFYHHEQHSPVGPQTILPDLSLLRVSSVQVRPPGPSKLEIRAERTNQVWWLTEPLIYPAEANRVDAFLEALEKLTPATFIGPAELRARPNADEDYGFASPQAGSVVVFQDNHRLQVLIGLRTAPGDQFFLQVVGREGVYVVDAEILGLLPRSADDWRDLRLVSLRDVEFDRLTVTNNAKVFELHRDSEKSLWRMVRPFQARANHARIEELLEQLNSLRVHAFISDAPGVELEPFGLQAPQLQIALSRGTNLQVLLHFGKSPTNNQEVLYAQRSGHPSIVTVPETLVAPWRASVQDFRDPHLVSLTRQVDEVQVQSEQPFSLRRSTNGWQILPADVKADSELAENFVLGLTSLRIAQYVKDVVIEADLPGYGLAPPTRGYLLKSYGPGLSNQVDLVDLKFGFGTNGEDRVYARRTDESFVYAVTLDDFRKLPQAAWQVRDRKIWNWSVDDLSQLRIQHAGRARELVRKGPHDWSLAPGSQGIINDLAIEATMHALLATIPHEWVACGESNRAKYGFTAADYTLKIVPIKGEPLRLEFGQEGPSATWYAGIVLDGEFRVFELPWLLYRDIATYLSVPAEGKL